MSQVFTNHSHLRWCEWVDVYSHHFTPPTHTHSHTHTHTHTHTQGEGRKGGKEGREGPWVHYTYGNIGTLGPLNIWQCWNPGRQVLTSLSFTHAHPRAPHGPLHMPTTMAARKKLRLGARIPSSGEWKKHNMY